uniref:Uncharacterized protein n=1 Tax=Lotus japonicus TaxID=34305 RepID=I3S2G1_LOTJA|nr:unknown [Lotus japonicus]
MSCLSRWVFHVVALKPTLTSFGSTTFKSIC